MSDPWKHRQTLHPGWFALDFLFCWVVLLVAVTAYVVPTRSWRARRATRTVDSV